MRDLVLMGWVCGALLSCDGGVSSKGRDAALDGGERHDAASSPHDAADDAAATRHWRCVPNAYGCTCDNNAPSMALREIEACTGACCVSVVRESGEQVCGCLSEEGAMARKTTCDAWVERELARCGEGVECSLSETCPPGAASPDDGGSPEADPLDAGGRDADPPRTGADASVSVTDSGSSTVDQGSVQHCVFIDGCMEFRRHSPLCFESNQINCESGFAGTYAIGACPADDYSRSIASPTGCGETISYLF